MARRSPLAALPMLLGVLVAVGAALWVVRDGSERESAEAAAPRAGDVAPSAAEEGGEVTLRAPQDPPPQVEEPDRSAAAEPPSPPPPPEPQGFEDGGRAQLADWSWKHGQYDEHHYRQARAALARELARYETVPPERQQELVWLQQQIAQAQEASGDESADDGADDGEQGSDEDGGGR